MFGELFSWIAFLPSYLLNCHFHLYLEYFDLHSLIAVAYFIRVACDRLMYLSSQEGLITWLDQHAKEWFIHRNQIFLLHIWTGQTMWVGWRGTTRVSLTSPCPSVCPSQGKVDLLVAGLQCLIPACLLHILYRKDRYRLYPFSWRSERRDEEMRGRRECTLW